VIPAAVAGSAIHRWADGGDLNKMMVAVIQVAKMRYTITGVLLNQGAADFVLHTPEDQYRSDLNSLIDTIRAQEVSAPFFITRSTVGGNGWSKDNPIAKAQASLADRQRAIFDGPNTDHDVTPLDRYDGLHFAASGQEKYTDAPGPPPCRCVSRRTGGEYAPDRGKHAGPITSLGPHETSVTAGISFNDARPRAELSPNLGDGRGQAAG
jgi:Carbohydrate esterase, sialic acid-specific acetylesterase